MTQLNAHNVLCLVRVYCGLDGVNGERDYCDANLRGAKEGHGDLGIREGAEGWLEYGERIEEGGANRTR